MFNHSRHGPNVGWIRDFSTTCVRYYALRDIADGEELCIDYGKVWLEDVDAPQLDEADEEGGGERLGSIEVGLIG